MLPILFAIAKIFWVIVVIIALWNITKKLFSELFKIIKYNRVKQLFEAVSKIPLLNKFDAILNNLYQKLNNLTNLFSDIYLLRVPIIASLILIFLPIIAQFFAPKFLQNIFVMENGNQLITVMIFATLSSLSIVSLIKNIIVIKDTKLNINPKLRKQDQENANLFRNTRIGLGFLLFFPTWLSLFFNSVIITQWEDGWNYFVKGMFYGIVLFVIFIGYDYRNEITKIFPLFQKIIDFSETILDSITKSFLSISYKNLTNEGKIKFRRILDYTILFLIGLIFYGIAIYRNSPTSIPQGEQNQAPALLYVLLIIWILTLLIGGATFYFDKYTKFNIPVIVLLILFSALSYGVWEVDHYFKLQDSEIALNYENDFTTAVKNRLCQEYVKDKKDQSCSDTLVVVAASGGGIQASGWTAQVLSGLQEKLGKDFTKSIGLISSTSGGSVGTMFYLDKLENGILTNSEEMIRNSTDDWLDSVAWGLAYPDLLRLVGYPIAYLVDDGIYLDRGYSLEKDWQRNLSKSELTLDNWYNQAKNGEIPIPVFNSTIVENGRRFLVSPMKFIPGEMKYYADQNLLEDEIKDLKENKKLSEKDTKLLEKLQTIKQSKAFDFRTLYNNCGNTKNEPCTIDVTTAARFSASFPYVSPMPRNDRDNTLIDSQGKEIKDHEGKIITQNYHMADGGYFDNAGAFTAIEWLDRLLEEHNDNLNIKKVILIQINAFPEDVLKTQQIGAKGFATVGLGHFFAQDGVRTSTQIARNIEAVKLLKKRWTNKVEIQEFAFTFPEKDVNRDKYNQPLSWRLSSKEKNNLKDAWETDEKIKQTLGTLKNFW